MRKSSSDFVTQASNSSLDILVPCSPKKSGLGSRFPMTMAWEVERDCGVAAGMRSEDAVTTHRGCGVAAGMWSEDVETTMPKNA